jgi:hypothetical protein
MGPRNADPREVGVRWCTHLANPVRHGSPGHLTVPSLPQPDPANSSCSPVHAYTNAVLERDVIGSGSHVGSSTRGCVQTEGQGDVESPCSFVGSSIGRPRGLRCGGRQQGERCVGVVYEQRELDGDE